jgi:hypothetical protein
VPRLIAGQAASESHSQPPARSHDPAYSGQRIELSRAVPQWLAGLPGRAAQISSGLFWTETPALTSS